MGEVENHVCCDCKTKKKPRLVDFFRFKRKGKVGGETGDGVEEDEGGHHGENHGENQLG